MRIGAVARTAYFLLFLVACEKHDLCPEPHKKVACHLAQSIVKLRHDDAGSTISQYRKEYDAVTGKVAKVVASIYQEVLSDSVALLVRYTGQCVYFLNEN